MTYRLILSDVDSTLIENEVIDLLASYTDRAEDVSRITERAMRGELDFERALNERVSILAGLPISIFKEVASSVRLSPGAEELKRFCQANGIKFGAVSGGFIQVLQEIPFFSDLDHLKANNLEISDGTISGRVLGEIVDRSEKARQLQLFAANEKIDLAETIAIGDGANDLEMIELAGLGVAYRGKEILRKRSDLSLESSLAELIPVLIT